jgi:hypothetical protein
LIFFFIFEKKILASGLVEISKSKGPKHKEWEAIEFGLLCFEKDYEEKSFFFRQYEIAPELHVSKFFSSLINFIFSKT